MNKKDIRTWLFATACLGLLSTVTGCKEDEHPDQAIPTKTPQEPTAFTEQVLWPSNLSRVSVHDPSVVYEPSSWSYYIFGSHRAVAKSVNMMTWSTVTVPWAVDGVSGAGNDVAFTDPSSPDSCSRSVSIVRHGGYSL